MSLMSFILPVHDFILNNVSLATDRCKLLDMNGGRIRALSQLIRLK
jgi:hypothetical protein